MLFLGELAVRIVVTNPYYTCVIGVSFLLQLLVPKDRIDSAYGLATFYAKGDVVAFWFSISIGADGLAVAHAKT